MVRALHKILDISLIPIKNHRLIVSLERRRSATRDLNERVTPDGKVTMTTGMDTRADVQAEMSAVKRASGLHPSDLEPANFSEMIEALTAVGVGLGVAKRTIDRLGDTRLDRVSELLGRTLDQYWRASRVFPRVPHVPDLIGWGQPPSRTAPRGEVSRNG